MDTEHEELDTFLRRAARMAALGAAIGAVVGAAKSARHASADGAVEEERPEPEEFEEEQPQAEAVQEPEVEDEADEADEPEQDVREQDEPEPQAQDTDQPEQEQEEDEEAERSEEPEPQSSNGGGDELAQRVLQRLQELTGREPDGVLGLKRQDGGWLMSVEVVELRRVPSTTDVLATYEVTVDGDGEIQEYRRTGRYVRGRGETG